MNDNYDNYEHDKDSDGEWWKLNGKYHRVDGPAVIWSDGTSEWHLHGQYHRIGGPAICDLNPEWDTYCIHGIAYSKTRYYQELLSAGHITKEELFLILL